MREGLAGVGAFLGGLFVLAQVIFWLGVGTGVVREHCLDKESSAAAQAVDVDSKWTFILWPPSVFANADPAGTCVRNSPLREALNSIGIWSLAEPEDQVREHVVDQLEEGRS